MTPAVSIKKVSKTYASDVNALSDVSFDIKNGEFFGLLGPNGAGKSTLINIISGPTKITSGQIEIYGRDISIHPQEAKMILGVVPQEISFDSFFTVNESLLLQSGYYGIRNNQKYIDEILEKLNLQDKKHAKTRTLSGGMKRRLLIAKSLVHKPRILILDEPTAGVDVELRHILWKYVQQLNQEGLTILLTTHYLEEAENLCERIGIINHGRLIALDYTRSLTASFGDTKKLIITTSEKIDSIPSSLLHLKPTRRKENQLVFCICEKSVTQLLADIHASNLSIKDIDTEAEKLEDVFIALTSNRET